jgi:hypothetical protein
VTSIVDAHVEDLEATTAAIDRRHRSAKALKAMVDTVIAQRCFSSV